MRMLSSISIPQHALIPSSCRRMTFNGIARKGLVFAALACVCISQIEPVRAEYETSAEYLRPKFSDLIKNAALKGRISNNGVPQAELQRCSNVVVAGLPTWSDDEEPKGRPFYIWFPEGISVVCWEFFKEILPKKPFELVRGVSRSRIKQIGFNPFSDPGPSIFFFFEK
jgi:hypothetical protein